MKVESTILPPVNKRKKKNIKTYAEHVSVLVRVSLLRLDGVLRAREKKKKEKKTVVMSCAVLTLSLLRDLLSGVAPSPAVVA